MTVRVLVVDDQRIVREGLQLVLGLLPEIELVGVADCGERGVDAVSELSPDVVLMDLRMPGIGGVEAIRRLRRLHPSVRCIVLTTYADDDSVFPALDAGARGYLTKDVGANDLAAAIHSVASGEGALNPAVQGRLLDRMERSEPGRPTRTPHGLTSREAEVLTLLATGLSNEEIARHLYISLATVKSHINHLFAKAGVRDRAQAVAYAYDHGLAPGAPKA